MKHSYVSISSAIEPATPTSLTLKQLALRAMCCLGLGGGGGGGGSKSWRRELGLTNTAHIDTNTHTPTHIQGTHTGTPRANLFARPSVQAAQKACNANCLCEDGRTGGENVAREAAWGIKRLHLHVESSS